MNAGWKPWLPADALANGAVERALAEVARCWSAKWFPRQAVSVWGEAEAPASIAAAAGDDGRRFHTLEDGLALSFGERERLAIGGLMLDARIEPKALTAADREVLHDLADHCIDDLCLQLADVLARPQAGSWSSGGGGGEALPLEDARSYRLGVAADEPLLRIAVADALAVRFIKGAASSRAAPPPLRPLASALARQEVAVSAMVGRSALTLEDLAALAPGDVLVLDRAVGAPTTLAIDGALTAARAAVQEVSGRLHLKIVQPLS